MIINRAGISGKFEYKMVKGKFFIRNHETNIELDFTGAELSDLRLFLNS